MYLKSLEMMGFKSFADKTRLEFEPGLTAIVGPNGCGKSNISDALRWVLGEQSPKALRGSKMEDCIFNGTDTRKPMSMAEVSVTFADCEKVLGTDYNEVTVTRRVFRSGEGQYFLNKVPCRLKDIQRLFMDTGIGTDSYSILEQGRIDQVLSAHPEDRRAVFEEASGITRFKADKKEALRKLEQTEANLLRLADVIREVKRQIGSLQRQAGKARRYKEIQAELRKFDIYLNRQKMQAADNSIRELEARISALSEETSRAHAEVEELERGAAVLRETVVRTEREIGTVLEAATQAQNRLDHARELIQVNRQRIHEYRELAQRDSSEIEETQRALGEKERELGELQHHLASARAEQAEAEKKLRQAHDNFEREKQQVESTRAEIQSLRAEALDFETLQVRLQNELVRIESRERSSVIQRERLAAEKAQLARVVATYEKREAEMDAALKAAAAETASAEDALKLLATQKERLEKQTRELEAELADARAITAALREKVNLLTAAERSEDGLPAGVRQVLNRTDEFGVAAGKIIGSLAARVEAEPEYQIALEAVLRPWLDALVIMDSSAALEILKALSTARSGAARLLAVTAPTATPIIEEFEGAERLIDHVKCPEEVRPLLLHLLGNVFVVADVAAFPMPPPPGTVWVTHGGAIMRSDHAYEFWKRDEIPCDPLSRKHALAEAQQALEALIETGRKHEERLGELSAETSALERTIEQAQRSLDEKKMLQAQREGESRVVAREAAEARQRLETVTWELENLEAEGHAGDTERQKTASEIAGVQRRREDIATRIQTRSGELQTFEETLSKAQSELTELRILSASVTQQCEHLAKQCAALDSRIAEMQAAIAARSKALLGYQESISKLENDIAAAESQLASLEAAVESNQAKAESLKRSRERQTQELREIEHVLAQKRATLEELRDSRSGLELKCSETRLRRQSQLERLMSEYHLNAEQVFAEPEPQWEGDVPSLESLETMVAELRAKLDAMGPVNLVAIEEYKELEERYAFLTAQEQDLINSKQQLMEMIRKINRTTSEMFRSTFEQINANFQTMFAQLFNGGTAKLVLVDEEDVLESGIEIIARPPGKRLQNVSLLSGGERTLAAVALLFAIYMIRPSPFCLLDELDAALDESNIGRFIKMLQSFLSQSQFVVITHNRQTIAAADILYGVTMPEKGVSNIVSMRFMERRGAVSAGADSQPAKAPAEAAPPPLAQ